MNAASSNTTNGLSVAPGKSGRFFCLLILAFLMVCARPIMNARASDPAADFEAANRLYEEGKYSDAAAAYDKLLTNGIVSEAIYYNRGNAFLKNNRLGRAIASYREAQRLSPRDRPLQANLQLVRAHAGGGPPDQISRWSGLLGALSLNEWTCLTAVVFWLFFIFLFLGLWRKELKDRLRKGLVASALALVIFGIGFGISLHSFLTPSAIVIAGEADIRNGPLDESQSIFKVRDGTELDVVDAKDGWLQVTDSAQRTGWLRQNQTLLFGTFPVQK